MRTNYTDNKTICGIDEAGRGALAGPLVAAAVMLHCPLEGIAALAKIKTIKDGKLLKPKQRTAIYRALQTLRVQIAVETIHVVHINKRGIGWANKQAMRNLIKRKTADAYILDGKINVGKIQGKTNTIHSIVDADATISEVMLAGIVAKVTRDRLMRRLHKEFPTYKWWTNKGYGTKSHIHSIRMHGVSKHHRTIFVKTALSKKM